MTSASARRAILISGLLVASLLAPVSFGADITYDRPDKGPVAFEFQYRQADLATQRGAHKVYRTLVYRAIRACEHPGEAPISLRRTDSECVDALVERVVRQIGSDTLAREWQGTRRPDSGTALAQVMD